MKTKNTVCFFLLMAAASLCTGQTLSGLSITPSDIRLEKAADGQYHLYIRKKPDIESILLTETTRDPSGTAANYAYRAAERNDVNGDEKRILDGQFLVSESARYSLIDSTPEAHKEFGEAFHILIPQKLLYGYPWTRNGEVTIATGTFINIRAYQKKYADYSGAFQDNPFMFDFKAPKPEMTDSYSSKAAAAFELISSDIRFSRGPESIVDDIMEALLDINPKTMVDVVFAVDATGSMKDDIEKVRKDFIPRLHKELLKFGSLRLGLLLYRDYGDTFKYKNLPVKYFPFSDKPDDFFKALNGFTIRGNEGGDIPEAVYEALYAALNFYDWNSGAVKKVILIGDAEPHPKPRGIIKCSKELVEKQAAEKNITIKAIITPDKNSGK